jgi:hypothetical protein
MAKTKPTKLTPERHKIIVQLIREGNYIVRACDAVGIGRSTYEDWMRRAEADDARQLSEGTKDITIYQTFRNDIKKAESDFIADNLRLISTAAIKEWTAAAWLLERKYPADFGRRIEITPDTSGIVELLKQLRDSTLAIPDTKQLGEGKSEADND